MANTQIIEDFVFSAKRVIEMWESGNLAEAVNDLRIAINEYESDKETLVIPTAIVMVEGGLVQDVKTPDGFRIEVRDYDCEGCDDSGKPEYTDQDGTHCHISIWESTILPNQ